MIAYEGTNYLGWQETKEGPSIEQTLRVCLEQILQHPVSLQAASRTDAGVHARAQVVNFFTHKDISKLQKSLNSLLPSDITVLSCEVAHVEFHPTLQSKGKEYRYQICLGESQLPFHRNYSWHVSYPLSIDTMKSSAKTLIGTHDFSAFTNEKQDDNVRTLFSISLEELDKNRLEIVISGDKFLYKMVRNIVGTLIDIGRGKLSQIEPILASLDRTKAGVTAPAHGLTLAQVFYGT
jgi:tRNA pseudouridine38-40 synthase